MYTINGKSYNDELEYLLSKEYLEDNRENK
jgi:hypothetical protein